MTTSRCTCEDSSILLHVEGSFPHEDVSRSQRCAKYREENFYLNSETNDAEQVTGRHIANNVMSMRETEA